jgi:hypothetical protein
MYESFTRAVAAVPVELLFFRDQHPLVGIDFF